MVLFLFGISMGEIVLLFLVVLMLFGSKKIPDLARGLGKGMNEFRKAADDIKREFSQSAEEIREDLSEMENNIRQNSNEIRGMAKDVYNDADVVTSDAVADIYKLDQPEISSEDDDLLKEEEVQDNETKDSIGEDNDPKEKAPSKGRGASE
jgi:sec-independent protein translocase protein TatA